MEFIEPKIFRIAQTKVNSDKSEKWLKYIGADDWETNSESEAELLIELCGRRCYKAFGVELNPNLSRVREGNKEYVDNILKVHHGSVLEHAYVTYAIEDVSRVFTHEIVRHRLCNFSQESLRFVRPTQLKAYFPGVYDLKIGSAIGAQIEDIFEREFTHLEEVQKELVELCHMEHQANFVVKKLLQSANRRLMPIGMATGIIVTSNHRNWRHMIEMRTEVSAEEEIRYVFDLIASDIAKEFPAIYQDAGPNDNRSWAFKHGRV